MKILCLCTSCRIPRGLRSYIVYSNVGICDICSCIEGLALTRYVGSTYIILKLHVSAM